MKLIILLLTACLLSACEKKATTTTQDHSSESVATTTPSEKEEVPPCCSDHPTPKAVEASADSIYQITSPWKDAGGKTRTLSSLGGTVQVITMGYSTCKFACPRLLADMQIIENGLSQEVREKTHFAFFSIDPETDTPARLTEYRKENKIPSDRWTLLTADESTVQELAVVLGLKYRRTTKSDFAHSNLIIVLNKKGEIIHRQEGLAADPATTIKAVQDAQ